MSESTNKYIAYIIAPPHKRGDLHDPNVEQSIAFQQSLVEQYIQEEPGRELVDSLVEQGEKKRNRAKWPVLEETLKLCKQHNAKLIIAELRNLTNNDSFTKLLREFNIQFYCCDQPLVSLSTLGVVVNYQKNLREIHGKLIRKGLQKTTAKSGNPHAREVISKVNRPKIEKAIMFSFVLQPIVADFREKGFSQRRMVKELNDMGFHAPEGGNWVLSQLQKVLDRIKLNELALDLEDTLFEMLKENKSHSEIADELNASGIAPVKKNQWDEKQVKKVVERVREIYEIVHITQYSNVMMPIINDFRAQGKTDPEIIEIIANSKVMAPAAMLEEIAA